MAGEGGGGVGSVSWDTGMVGVVTVGAAGNASVGSAGCNGYGCGGGTGEEEGGGEDLHGWIRTSVKLVSQVTQIAE